MTVSLPPGATVLPDADAVARAAAGLLLTACAEVPEGPIAVCLAGGSTPKRLYRLLAGPDYAEALPWDRIHWFFGDDRLVAGDDPRSNLRMVLDAFGPDVPIPAAHLHAVPTDLGLEDAAVAYDRALRAFYGADRLDPARPLFDLVLLGLGEDGHTASLFPGMPALTVTDALAVGVPEAGLEPFVPRVTLTFAALGSARRIVFLATGAGKRAPLARLAAGEDLPAGRVRGSGSLQWFLDAAAAA